MSDRFRVIAVVIAAVAYGVIGTFALPEVSGVHGRVGDGFFVFGCVITGGALGFSGRGR